MRALVQEWRRVDELALKQALKQALASMDEIDERVLNIAGELSLT